MTGEEQICKLKGGAIAGQMTLLSEFLRENRVTLETLQCIHLMVAVLTEQT
jgi:hypothetical protein